LPNETRARSLAKMATYRVAAAALLAAVTFYLTGSTGLTGAVTLVFNVGGALVYYGIERLWNDISWGRK
jgi:uncharacterized membrane protein